MIKRIIDKDSILWYDLVISESYEEGEVQHHNTVLKRNGSDVDTGPFLFCGKE